MADDPDNIYANLASTRIAPDLLAMMAKRLPARAVAAIAEAEPAPDAGQDDAGPLPVLIEGNARMPLGAGQARRLIALMYARQRAGQEGMDSWIGRLTRTEDPPVPDLQIFAPDDMIDLENSMYTPYYLRAWLGVETLGRLSALTIAVPPSGKAMPLVYKLWQNHAIERHVFESVRTVKGDAARAAFAAAGSGIIWAVADTGIDGRHPHFLQHDTLQLPDGLEHHDFTDGDDALLDTDGHGTHVAGIIAGETRIGGPTAMTPTTGTLVAQICVNRSTRQPDGKVTPATDLRNEPISGIAPLCKLVSLKVLGGGTGGDVGLLLAAIGYIQQVNDNGSKLRIHGLNLSLGYGFDARWFAAGRSPLCIEVDRLVRSGVSVVVAAGNSGYGPIQALNLSFDQAAHLGTINDPGNAEEAITVGSTHRDEPHNFGVSYFSGKGPTADGRMKPDLVAPGERIVSCALVNPANPAEAPFKQDSGTSMAAPHVSGCVAAFLSVRREYRGEPWEVKAILKRSATDLGRQPTFQGAGLIDVMRALQSV